MLAFCAAPLLGFGQKMTDSQIVDFVKQEQARGTNQQDIVAKLLQKGVTPEQLRRIRRKYEAEQAQPGALDLNSDPMQRSGQGPSRQRTNRERAQEQLQQRNGYMLRSQNGGRNLTAEERQEQMNEEIAFLDIDSLVYYQNLLRDESEVFGRNIFNNPALTFEPSQNMATPAHSRLGAGDNVIIDVWGSSQQTISNTISPDGVIVVEGVGPIKLAGLSMQQATAPMEPAYSLISTGTMRSESSSGKKA